MGSNDMGDPGIAAGRLVIGHKDDELAVGKQLDRSEAHGGTDQVQRLSKAEWISFQLVTHPVGGGMDEKIVFDKGPLRGNGERRPCMAGGDTELMWILVALFRIYPPGQSFEIAFVLF